MTLAKRRYGFKIQKGCGFSLSHILQNKVTNYKQTRYNLWKMDSFFENLNILTQVHSWVFCVVYIFDLYALCDHPTPKKGRMTLEVKNVFLD